MTSESTPSHDHGTGSTDDTLSARLTKIEARVAAIEAHVGLALSPRIAPNAADTPITPPPLPPPLPARVDAPRRRPAESSPVPQAQPRDDAAIETTVGGRWYAVAGAVVVMIGMCLGLKFAYDQGLMLMFTPSTRCLAVAAFGSLLIAVGWRRRSSIGDWAATSLLAAGVGSIYCSAWAAYGFYGLVDDVAAFLLLGMVAAGGILISALSGLLAVGVLAIFGGLLAPIVLSTGHAPPWVMASHLLAVMSVGSAVAAWKRGRFAALRSIAWWGVVLLGTSWAGWIDLWRADPAVAVVFPALFWALIHGGMWLEFRDDAGERDEVAPTDHPAPPWVFEAAARPTARAMISSFSTTLWCGWMSVHAASISGFVEPWVVSLAYAAACSMMSIPIASTLTLLRDVPRTDRERLGTSLLVQVGGLIIATVGFGLGGSAQVIAWLGMGVAAVVAGRSIRTTRLDTYGLVLLTIGSLRLMYEAAGTIIAAARPVATAPAILELAGLRLDEWSMLMLGAGVAWLLAARVTQHARDLARNPHAIIAAAMGTLALIVAPMVPGSSDLSTAAWAALIALAGLALTPLIGAAACMPLMATGAMVVAGGCWNVACLHHWTERDWAFAVIHPGLAVGTVIAAGSAWLAHANARRGRDQAGTIAAVAAGLLGSLIFLAATTLEVARVSEIVTQDQTSRRAAVSIWWAALSIAILAIGFARRWRWPRYAGLALMGIAAVKALSYDLAGIGQGWRVISVLGVGLMMLAVAVLYGKLAARPDSPRTPTPSE